MFVIQEQTEAALTLLKEENSQLWDTVAELRAERNAMKAAILDATNGSPTSHGRKLTLLVSMMRAITTEYEGARQVISTACDELLTVKDLFWRLQGIESDGSK